MNPRCQLSSDFLHVEQILNFPVVYKEGWVTVRWEQIQTQEATKH